MFISNLIYELNFDYAESKFFESDLNLFVLMNLISYIQMHILVDLFSNEHIGLPDLLICLDIFVESDMTLVVIF